MTRLSHTLLKMTHPSHTPAHTHTTEDDPPVTHTQSVTHTHTHTHTPQRACLISLPPHTPQNDPPVTHTHSVTHTHTHTHTPQGACLSSLPLIMLPCWDESVCKPGPPLEPRSHAEGIIDCKSAVFVC